MCVAVSLCDFDTFSVQINAQFNRNTYAANRAHLLYCLCLFYAGRSVAFGNSSTSPDPSARVSDAQSLVAELLRSAYAPPHLWEGGGVFIQHGKRTTLCSDDVRMHTVHNWILCTLIRLCLLIAWHAVEHRSRCGRPCRTSYCCGLWL